MPTVLFDLSVLATPARTRGIGRYVADLGRGLAAVTRRSSDFRLLGLEHLSWVGTATITDDIDCAIERLTAGGLSVPHAQWAYRVRVALARATRAAAPDLVHNGHPAATPLGAFSCPRLTTCHDLIPLHYPEHYLDWRDGFRMGRERLDHRRFGSADHVIAISETTANDLVTLMGIPRSRISVVYNGVDLTRWQSEPRAHDSEVRARYGLSESSYVLCVGAADWRKNPAGMVEALAQARRRTSDQDLKLVWAAALDTESRRNIERMAREAGAGEAVRLIGYVSDDELAALYRGAVAQLFVSRAEGFGYPVVEAMATGCPVVTSDCSSTAEIAADAAILVDPEDAGAIAAGITLLAEDPSARLNLSQRGVERARRFTLERMAEGTLEVYRKVLNETRWDSG